MRLVFTTSRDTLSIIKALQELCNEGSQATVVTDSIHFLYQIETLLNSGFKFAIIDPEGNQHLITKRYIKEEEDEFESDEGKAG